MFVLSDIPEEYTWPVKVQLPKDGKMIERTFKGRFRLLERDRARELLERMLSEQDGDLATEVFLGWPDGEIGDTDKDPLEPTAENVRMMLQKPPVYAAVLRAYRESAGGEKARQGN